MDNAQGVQPCGTPLYRKAAHPVPTVGTPTYRRTACRAQVKGRRSRKRNRGCKHPPPQHVGGWLQPLSHSDYHHTHNRKKRGGRRQCKGSFLLSRYSTCPREFPYSISP
ncbi:hypothetical protein [Bacteroides neonati]|uniref:hypothetical protein n=1 Tax=Bacteroides neonati TaxID=1347393 RepID=UPI0011DC9667|nr:hypothetical protein [Bacteroides neonati]